MSLAQGGVTINPHRCSQISGFRLDRLKRLSQLERWHFWFVGRQQLVNDYLKSLKHGLQRVLEVGCGTGQMVETLLQQGHQIVGLDLRPEGIMEVRKKFPYSHMIQADAHCLPLKSGAFDLVFLLDVLEHVDDKVVLSEIQRVLRGGGHAIITVPAMSWLWSFRDADAGHLRRYSSKQISHLLISNMLEIIDLRFYQCFLLPFVMLSRLCDRQSHQCRDMEERPAPLFNKILTWINKLEVKLGRCISWPWGSSLMMYCRKRIS